MTKCGAVISDESGLQLLRSKAAHASAPETLQHLSKQQVLARQLASGLGGEWGLLKFPRSWLPPGSAQATATINIRRSLLNQPGITPKNLDIALLSVSRLALIFFLLPQPTRSIRVFWRPSTVVKKIEAICRLAGRALSEDGDTGMVFSRIAVTPTGSFKPAERFTILHLMRLGGLGLWSDVPKTIQFDTLEARRRGQILPELMPDKSDPHQPFSDDFVGECGWRLAWLLEELGPSIIRCAHGLANIRAAVPNLGSFGTYDAHLRVATSAFLRKFKWTQRDGSTITSLPFPVEYEGDYTKEVGRISETSLPQRFSDFRAILKLLEGAHLFVFLLSCGGRASEMLSLAFDCVRLEEDVGNGFAEGRTYKLTRFVGGEARDWPLPEIGVTAIRQQQRLKSAVLALYPSEANIDANERPPESVWCRISRGASSFTDDYNEYLVDTIKMLGLNHLLGGRGLSAHRFRKTTARIIALAVVSAPELLMRLFGHREMQTTLYYILADPFIRSEVETIMKAQTIMLAENAIRDVENLGGLAAPRVQAAVAFAKARHGAEFQSVGVRELAETLTFSGQYWRLVRGHVICTKSPLQESPCKRGSTITDPANCQSKCSNRLEDGFLRDDVRRTLVEAIRQFEDAEKNGDEILSAEWLGQICANLHRFRDVDEELSAHSVVRQILAEHAPSSHHAEER